MNQLAKQILKNTGLSALLALTALALLSPGIAGAQSPQYLNDGAQQNARGGWDLPFKGTCMVVGDAGNSIATRPECIYTRFPALDASGCTTAGGSLTTATSRYCEDNVNNTVGTCVDSPPDALHPHGIDRQWTNGECVLTMKGYNRNQAVCQVQQAGTWTLYGAGKCVGAWQMPASNNSTYWDPLLFTSTTNPGPGDQCLRCHRSDTEWNGNRVRDVEDFLHTGHKNMARRVEQDTANPHYGMPWGGPPFSCSFVIYDNEEDCVANSGTWDPTEYPSNDAGWLFDWPNAQIDVLTGAPDPADLFWIYGDWLGPLPRAIYDAGSSATTGKPLMSYSCARCHTTGWTSDATIRTATTFPDIHGKQPEQSFPDLTWDGSTLGTTGKVNLAGGVTGDANLYGSWDNYGIVCSRCHSSAIADADGSCSVANLFDSATCTAGGGTWTAGNPRPAPFARGNTHHADVTNFDVVNGGYCSDLGIRNATKYTCELLGATWYSACSDDRWPSETLCKATSGCINPGNSHALSYTTEALCEAATAGECSIPVFTGSTPCAAGGGTWTAATATWWTAKTASTWTASYCSIGTCSNGLYTTQPTCVGSGATWTNTWSELFSCMDAGGDWTGNKERRGQMITNLCMGCHRQETGGLPYDSADPAGKLKVGPAHGTFDFVSHPHGNWYLNSPHGKFDGSFAQIPSGKFEFDMSGDYKSWFMTAGEAGNTGNGCTGCHDVHKSTVKATLQEGALHEECTECHAKDLNNMIHPGGPGTPLEEMATKPDEACISCHMPGGKHLFRITAEETYETLPKAAITALDAAACTAIGGTWQTGSSTGCLVNAPQQADGDYTRAVWVDVDLACGQCHGGGIQYAESTGDSNPASASITVANATDFLAGERVQIVGAGAVTYDDAGYSPGDFETFIKSISGNTLNLLGKPALAITGAPVIQNPVKNEAAYMNKATLAVRATGIHNDKPYVTFGYTLGSPNTLQVNVNASFSSCSGDIANCDAFTWSWGDSTPDTHAATPTASHIYAAGGTYTITLTIEEYGVSEGSKSKNVRVYAVDAPPVAGGTACASIIDGYSWVASLTDNSTDDNGVRQVTVNWGDGGAISSVIDTTPPYSLIGTVFPHTYLNAGTVTIRQTAYDTIGQTNVRTCPPVTLTTFSIAGGVFRSNGTTPVPSATVTLKKGTTTRTVYTNSLGLYSATNLKPGSYTVTVTKAGYDFGTAPQRTGIVIGPNATVTNINAVTP